MKVKILLNGLIQEIELPLACDYGAIIDNGVIVALVLPIKDDHVVGVENISRVVINQTIWNDDLKPKKEVSK